MIAEVLLFSFVLSLDSFSAALAMGFRRHSGREALRFAWVSGLSEGGIAFLGFLAGKHLLSLISSYDHWIAFGLVLAVGLRMIYKAIGEMNENPDSEEVPREFHSFGKILLVSVATSLDALGVGLGLGVAGKPIALYALAICAGAFLSTLAGLGLARLLSRRFGPACEILGGVILVIQSFQLLSI